jgi:hypothetical protein
MNSILPVSCYYYVSFGFFFWGATVRTQGLQLDPLHQPFFVTGFWDMVSQTICQVRLWTAILLISASWVARITNMSHWHLAVFYFIVYTLEWVTLNTSEIIKFTYKVIFWGLFFGGTFNYIALYYLFVWDSIFLCCLGWPWTYNSLLSVSQLQWLQSSTTILDSNVNS